MEFFEIGKGESDFRGLVHNQAELDELQRTCRKLINRYGIVGCLQGLSNAWSDSIQRAVGLDAELDHGFTGRSAEVGMVLVNATRTVHTIIFGKDGADEAD